MLAAADFVFKGLSAEIFHLKKFVPQVFLLCIEVCTQRLFYSHTLSFYAHEVRLCKVVAIRVLMIRLLYTILASTLL